MKYWYCIGIILFGMACSDKKIEQPKESVLSLQMATEGANRFEDYIRFLSLYVFRQTADGRFVYVKTLADLDADAIADLKDANTKGNAKYFTANLKIGTYALYLVGNARGQISSNWEEEVTTPDQVVINGTGGGRDSICFLGHAKVRVVTDYMPAVKITLNRIVSKLVLVLYGVPVQVKHIELSLENITTGVRLDGQLLATTRTVSQELAVRNTRQDDRDTLVTELIVLPSGENGSPFQLLFQAVNGQKKVKEMPKQVLLPDKYVRVSGKINDQPGGLLDFDIKMNILLMDYWLDKTLLDFSLIPQKL